MTSCANANCKPSSIHVSFFSMVTESAPSARAFITLSWLDGSECCSAEASCHIYSVTAFKKAQKVKIPACSIWNCLHLHALHWQILHVPIQLALKGKGQPSNILLMSPSFSADAPWPALWIRNAKRSVCSVIGIHMDKIHSTRELNWFNPICILQISAVHVSSTSDCAMLKEPVLEA